jgi:hypothetical protein
MNPIVQLGGQVFSPLTELTLAQQYMRFQPPRFVLRAYSWLSLYNCFSKHLLTMVSGRNSEAVGTSQWWAHHLASALE